MRGPATADLQRAPFSRTPAGLAFQRGRARRERRPPDVREGPEESRPRVGERARRESALRGSDARAGSSRTPEPPACHTGTEVRETRPADQDKRIIPERMSKTLADERTYLKGEPGDAPPSVSRQVPPHQGSEGARRLRHERGRGARRRTAVPRCCAGVSGQVGRSAGRPGGEQSRSFPRDTAELLVLTGRAATRDGKPDTLAL